MSASPFLGTSEDNEGDQDPIHIRAARIVVTHRYCHFGLAGCGGTCLVIFVLVWLLQGFMYLYATTLSGCKASSLAGFNYDGDDGRSGNQDNVVYNLMPRMSLLVERAPWLWGDAFDVYPTTMGALKLGKVGTWWRTWGPIFFTYTYEDMSSKTTVYMRRNLLRIGSSHRIARCDGKEPYVTFTEGTNYFGNVLRSWFGYNQAKSFKVYNEDDQAGIVEESGTGSGGMPSLTFRSMNNDVMGTSVLQSRNHGDTGMIEWLCNINNRTQDVPWFVQNAATLLFAYFDIGQGGHSPASLAAMPGPSGERMKQQHQQKQQKREQTITVSSAPAASDKILLNSTAIASGSRATSNLQQQVQRIRQSTPKAPVMIEQHI